MKKKIIFFIWFLIGFLGNSQNLRDKFINDSIQPKIINKINNKEYNNLKENIKYLEDNCKCYEPEYKYYLLEKSFNFNDIDFFKRELTILVEIYGFNVAYMNESESYYYSIIKGELKDWFKEMYIEKHSVWLKNNFEKQIDLRKLNNLRNDDQIATQYYARVQNFLGSENVEINNLNKDYLQEVRLADAMKLKEITKKYKKYPTAKTFAIIQNPFYVVELHNFQSELNFPKVWDAFKDYYELAYLKNEITFNKFKDFDYFSLKYFGYQEFGLIKKLEDIPEWMREGIEDVKIKDENKLKGYKEKFNW